MQFFLFYFVGMVISYHWSSVLWFHAKLVQSICYLLSSCMINEIVESFHLMINFQPLSFVCYLLVGQPMAAPQLHHVLVLFHSIFLFGEEDKECFQ